MAPESRRPAPPLIDRLRAEPQVFDFFQAVRVLEAHARESRKNGAPRPGDPVGHDHAPEHETVRFCAVPSLAFPAASVRDLREDEPDAAAPAAPGGSATRRPWQMRVNFLGLVGPAGVLPPHYTELVLQRVQLRDVGLRDFLDLLQHRAVSFFYRAGRKYRFPFEWERERHSGGEDRFTDALACLCGLGLRHARGRQTLDDASIVFYGGHFAHRPRSAVGLESLLHDFFGLPMRVEQLVGRWLHIPLAERSRMAGAGTLARHNGIGAGLALGDRVWDVQSKMRVHAGPIRYAEFARLLAPGGPGQARMRDLLRTYLGIGMDFELSVELEQGSAPPLRLSSDARGGSRLGVNGWLCAAPGTARVAPAVFSLDGR